MQRVVPEITDLGKESQTIHELYGVGNGEANDFARSCLLTRRLLEHGVRFVQLFSGGAFQSPRVNWDGHEDCKKNHLREAARIDQPITGFIKDLRQRGMLEDTVILFTSEFGRTPLGENRGGRKMNTGRDHHPFAFSMFMAGGGIKGGQVYGKSDEIGWSIDENPVHINDLHATLLHQFGIEHTKLTYRFQGRDFRLTDVGGNLIKPLIS